MNSVMRIGELGQAAGVDIETIRYYEKMGLLSKPERTANGYRAYGQTHLEQLVFVRHCRALDISLTDVASLLDLVKNPKSACNEVNKLIDAQLARVRARLKSMQALERQLVTLQGRCSSGKQAGECGILHELIAAAQGEACACHTESHTHD